MGCDRDSCVCGDGVCVCDECDCFRVEKLKAGDWPKPRVLRRFVMRGAQLVEVGTVVRETR